MRRTMLLGLGLVGTVALQTGALGQFAADRTPPPTGQLPTLPSSAPPTSPTPTLSPALQPAAQPKPPSAPHPWAVRPEYGAWFISVKSYTKLGKDDNPRAKAEQLAQYIRQTHNAGAYLFEWGAEERQKEEERQAIIRKRKQAEYAPFLAVRDQMKVKAAQEGTVFLDSPEKYHIGKVTIPEQWAVIIGGFKDMDSARQALDTIRKWPAPEDKSLLDQGIIDRVDAKEKVEDTKFNIDLIAAKKNGPDLKDNKIEGAYFNPFKTAMVVPNPAIKRGGAGQAPPADPALAKLNEAEDLSLLKARKPWTLMVKRYSAPTRVEGREGSPTVVEKLFGTDESAKLLEASAKQARSLAEALRHPNMRPQRFESFVLHGRQDSIVTVGQFDSPEDPLLAEMWTKLYKLSFEVKYEDGRPTEFKRMFDVVIPMQVPR